MPIVHPCASDGCNTLTMGELCLDCERALLDASAAAGFADPDERDENVAAPAATT